MRHALVAVMLLSHVAHAGPRYIDIPRIDRNFLKWPWKGAVVWSKAFDKAEELLKKLERAIGGEMEEFERQCFLQEAMKHLIPEQKDGLKFTGEPQGDVTPDHMKHALEKLNQANRCSPTNRGYVAFHAWKDADFQEPRQLPSGEKRSLTEFLRGIGAMGAATGVAEPLAPAAAGVGAGVAVPLLGNPDSYTPSRLREPPDSL